MTNQLRKEYNLFKNYAEGELVGCPFCGSSEVSVELKYRVGGAWESSYSARCGQCEARGPEKDNPYDSETEWNKRV